MPLEEIGRANWDAATTAFSRDVRAVGAALRSKLPIFEGNPE